MAELPKLYIDNPGGDWLQRKLEQAQEDYQTAPIGSTRKNIGSSNVTGYFKTNLDLSPDLLKDLPGALGEEDFRGSSVKLELLEKSIREQGYKPSPILINVREDGQPFIVEGNHRVVEALKSGRTRIPVELKYLRGAEDAEGPLSMDRLREFYGTLPKDQPRLPTSGATMADSLPVVPASTELTPVSLKSMNRSQLMNLAERMGYDGPAAGQRSIGSLFSVLHSQLGFSGIKDRSEVRFELGLTESTVDDMESAYKRGQDRFFNREGGRPEGPPTSVPMEDLETAALDLYRKGHRSGLSEPYEGARRLELKNIVEELSVRRLRTPFDIARDLKAQAGVDDTPQITGRDQPRLPPLLEGPPEEPGKKPSKGRVMRGIGSLMRGRNVFSLIQALREGYELLPEEYQVLDEALQYLKGTQFSIDKPGIESLKELLGISPEDLGETIPLPGPEDLPMDEASRLSRAEKLGFGPEIYYHGTAANIVAFDLNHPDRKDQGWLGTGVYLTDSPALGSVYATLKGYTRMDKDRAKNVMPLRIRLKNPYHATRQEKETMMLRMHNKSTADARQIADSWTEDLKKKGHDGVILQYDPKEVGKANAVREIVVFDTSNVKSAFSKFDPAYSRSPKLSKAAGGFIDKPLYDDRRMIG